VEVDPRPGRSPSASACEPYREIIEGALSKGRNAMAIWQDLVDGQGFSGRYASVKRFVNKLRGSPTPEARVVIETAPGEEAQVDYGAGPMVRDPDSGKYRRTRLFVLTLGHSSKIGSLAGVPFQHASMGGVARESVSPVGRRDSRRGAR
jgi:transposase